MNKGGGAATIVELDVTANGTYTAPSGVDGYSPVVVDVEPDVGTKTVTANGTYAASADDLDGYSSVTVNVDTDFYPDPYLPLISVTAAEGDDMRALPTTGTQYYPYVYLKARPSSASPEDPWSVYGKRFDGLSTEYIVTLWMDLIDVETGEIAQNYPQQIASTQASFAITDGGYCRIKGWTVSANASQVNVTIERYNTTYTKPIENTYGSATVTPTGALDVYLSGPFKIAVDQYNP